MSAEHRIWKNQREGTIFALEAISAYKKALELGYLELKNDLETAKPYDHSKREGEYEEKNEYFNPANRIGISFIDQNATSFAKMYYWNMLHEITEWEKQGKTLNKGMVCANLGVSSLAEGDIDGGIAYLSWAMHEDRAWIEGDQNNNIFKSDLYSQFTTGKHREQKSQFGKTAPWINLEKIISHFNGTNETNIALENIFNETEDSPEHRALFEGSLWIIHRNYCLLEYEKEISIFKENNNNLFTKLRLFDGVINLCRFIEFRIKKNEERLKILNEQDLDNLSKDTLGGALSKVFGSDWYKKVITEGHFPKFENKEEFKEFLEKRLTDDKSKELSLTFLLGIRNYGTHLCNPDVPIFFSEFARILEEIISAYMHYLRFREII